MQMNLFTYNPAKRRVAVPTPEVMDINGYWVPQAKWDKVLTTHDIQAAFRSGVRVNDTLKTSDWHLNPGAYGFWNKVIECGRSYMVGTSTPMKAYLNSHSCPLSSWQKVAYEWALQNPERILEVDTRTHHWRVFLRGEYVEFALPHQSFGGERNYVTKDGKRMVLVNVD